MAIRIDDDFMSAESAGRVIATARYSEDAAADGHGAWAVSYRPSHLFTRDQAITAMVLAERLAAGYGDDDPFVIGWREELDRCIRITTALAMVAVAVVAAVISYQHAVELVRSHGESDMTARLLPFTVDGLIWAASMVVLDASRRYHYWLSGAWVLASWPRSAPTWRIVWGMARSARWSVRGPRWRWLARLSC